MEIVGSENKRTVCRTWDRADSEIPSVVVCASDSNDDVRSVRADCLKFVDTIFIRDFSLFV